MSIRRGGSTLVPGSFALLALIHASLDARTPAGDDLLRAALRALRDRAPLQQRLRRVPRLLPRRRHQHPQREPARVCGADRRRPAVGDDDHLRVAAAAAETSVAAVGRTATSRTRTIASGDWTDCFHHLYVLASIRALAALNPHVDAAEFSATSERLHRTTSTFRGAGRLVNYYPDRLHPIDPHNYAATAIYAVLSGDEHGAARAKDLLQRLDGVAWDRSPRPLRASHSPPPA